MVLGLDFINELRTVTFKWKPLSEIDSDFVEQSPDLGVFELPDGKTVTKGERDTVTLMHGLIAQEVKAAMDAVGNTTFNGWEDGDSGQSVSREMFIMPLIKAVQELSAKITTLQSEIETLKSGG